MKVRKLAPGEAVVVPHRERRGKWTNILRGMVPGDRVVVDLEGGRKQSAQNCILISARRMGTRIKTTKMSDREILIERLPDA